MNERKAFWLKPLHRNLSKREDNEKKSFVKEGEKKIGKGCRNNKEAQTTKLVGYGGGNSPSCSQCHCQHSAFLWGPQVQQYMQLSAQYEFLNTFRAAGAAWSRQLLATGWKFGVPFLTGFSLLYKMASNCGALSLSYPMGTKFSFPSGKLTTV